MKDVDFIAVDNCWAGVLLASESQGSFSLDLTKNFLLFVRKQTFCWIFYIIAFFRVGKSCFFFMNFVHFPDRVLFVIDKKLVEIHSSWKFKKFLPAWPDDHIPSHMPAPGIGLRLHCWVAWALTTLPASLLFISFSLKSVLRWHFKLQRRSSIVCKIL